ncbi:uncharacterized protein LOC119734943 [Patiria miniata]|uniref:DDE Tnp4 domain-containing protein n=1 Tax=Patiria miniata TaxID=46514 RepID=A0A914ALQ4_PATMI|nr:uncharacterized protein LOC119734943 [Patiria miniata]
MPNDGSRLCSAHFISGKQSRNPLSPDYVPSVFPDTTSPDKKRKRTALERFEKREALKLRRRENAAKETAAQALMTLQTEALEKVQMEQDLQEEAAETLLSLQVHQPSMSCQSAQQASTSTSSPSDTVSAASIELECRRLLEENHHLKETVEHLSLSENSFKDDDKVKFCTGLPSLTLLQTVLQEISPFLNTHPKAVLSKFQQLLMTLMYLRLNLCNQDLAYRFNVNCSTVSRTVNSVIDVLYARLVPMAVFWPEREELRKTLPIVFRSVYPKCTVIIDCFEVTMERSSDQRAKSQTYSSYKARNTLKYLIGVAPQGAIIFISKGWGGRASDKHITENCGILYKLQPGDEVLADRGFNIHDSVGVYGATLKIPAFTKGKSQLSKEEAETTRKLASVRIHVERVIGLVRQKYEVLNGPVEICKLMRKDENMTTFDKVVHVACALTNLCTSIVPFD